MVMVAVVVAAVVRRFANWIWLHCMPLFDVRLSVLAVGLGLACEMGNLNVGEPLLLGPFWWWCFPTTTRRIDHGMGVWSALFRHYLPLDCQIRHHGSAKTAHR